MSGPDPITHPDEWAAEHKADCREFLRSKLAEALRPHVELMGEPGHLTEHEIWRELAGAMVALGETARSAAQREKDGG